MFFSLYLECRVFGFEKKNCDYIVRYTQLIRALVICCSVLPLVHITRKTTLHQVKTKTKHKVTTYVYYSPDGDFFHAIFNALLSLPSPPTPFTRRCRAPLSSRSLSSSSLLQMNHMCGRTVFCVSPPAQCIYFKYFLCFQLQSICGFFCCTTLFCCVELGILSLFIISRFVCLVWFNLC